MSELVVGQILEGKVSGITKFGAFVDFEGGKSGLVHISEISDEYVEKVEDYLKRNQKVKVKVLSIADNGKVSLSIKQALPKSKKPLAVEWTVDDRQKEMSFEDKLSKFLKDSNEKQDQLKTRDTRRYTRRRAGGGE